MNNVEEDYICELIPQLSPSIDKLQIAIKQMKNIKSPEIDGFPYAVYKNCENFPLTRIFLVGFILDSLDVHLNFIKCISKEFHYKIVQSLKRTVVCRICLLIAVF